MSFFGIALASLFTIHFASAAIDGLPREPRLPMVPPQLVQAIENELLPRVRTLSRPVTLWHWTHRSDPGIPLRGVVDSHDPHFSQYLARRADSYFRMSPRNASNVGTGLYVAIDPISTLRYGGARGGALIQMDLLPGARTIEVDYSAALTPNLQADLGKFGCSTYSIMEIFSNDDQPACESLRVAIARSRVLAAVGIRYAYAAEDFSFCGGSGQRPQVAFNFWDTSAFANVKGLTQELNVADPGTADKAIVRALFEANARSYDFGQHFVSPPDAMMPTPDALHRFAASHLVGCGNYPEDISSGN